MFKKISNQIARQFMAFIFLLLLMNGFLFLAADIGNARHQAGMRLQRMAQEVMHRTRVAPNGAIAVTLSPMMRANVRVVDSGGNAVYTGAFFEDIPFVRQGGFDDVTKEGEQYNMFTGVIERGGELLGYVQIGEVERLQLGDLPFRALLYLLVSAAISALTFGVGRFFARTSLQPAEQMVERLEQFTQDASHELRTPIAAMSSSLDLAMKTGKYKEGVESAKEDLKEVSVLVERLLELARLDKFIIQQEQVDLGLLIETAVEKFRPLAAEKQVTIEQSVVPGVMVEGDASLLRQVLGNLLSNAVKFSKDGGGTIAVTLTKDVLSIRDTGIGIGAASLPQIFQRFYQADTSRANDGFGLGLALVKRITELHGWSIDAASTEGEGTTFTIRFRKPGSRKHA